MGMLTERCDVLSQRVDALETAAPSPSVVRTAVADGVQDVISSSSSLSPHLIQKTMDCNSWDEVVAIAHDASRPCPFYATGTCKFGRHCKYAHVDTSYGTLDALGTAAASSASSPSQS